jgi:hypothetical protein
MSKLDTENKPDYSNDDPVCAKCFEDEDVADFIDNFDGAPGCAFCGGVFKYSDPLNF